VPAHRNRTIFLTKADRSRRVPRLPARPLPDHVYCGDGLEGLKALEGGSADLVFADPPYNRGKNFGNNRDRRRDYFGWTERWVIEARRTLREGGSIYVCSGWEHSGRIQEILSRHFTVRNRITWRREKGRGARRNWKQNMEDIWFATKGDDYFFNLVKWKKTVIAPYREGGKPKDWVEENGRKHRWTHPSNIWTDLCVPFWSMRENTPHPTQKPEKLVARIIEASSHKGDLVVDPFLGSGTTAVVARRLGRRYMGFEMNPDYIRLALKRLEMGA
jgi:site-specific DNA-methyltransferase (adenine-specific)